MNPDLLLLPRRSALLMGHDNTLDVLVRLQAPPPPGRDHVRPPLNLAIVIDRSGSMSGQPLKEAVRCAEFMIAGLTARDRVSIITYASQVEVLVPSTPVTDRARLSRALRGIHSGGATALHAGWLAGAEQVSAHLSSDSVSRILLLSDGQANSGLTHRDQIAEQGAALAEAGVSTSTYGLGRRFNEDLMGDLARSGGGNSYYGQSAEDLMDPFREEFDLLAALCGRSVTLSLTPAAGVSVELLNGYPEVDGGWRLPDLAYDGEAWALARLRIPAAVGDRPDAPVLLSARADMIGMDGEPIEPLSARLILPSLPAPAFGAVAEDALVRRRAQELEAANLQEKARLAALAGQWDRVQAIIQQARASSAENTWLQESLTVLEGYARRKQTRAFSKEAYYSSRKMRRRLTSQQEMDWSEGTQEPTFLRRKREQGRKSD